MTKVSVEKNKISDMIVKCGGDCGMISNPKSLSLSPWTCRMYAMFVMDEWTNCIALTQQNNLMFLHKINPSNFHLDLDVNALIA